MYGLYTNRLERQFIEHKIGKRFYCMVHNLYRQGYSYDAIQKEMPYLRDYEIVELIRVIIEEDIIVKNSRNKETAR